MIHLCETAGFDSIFVESVGIGQSETEIAQATDMLVLVIAPGSGDDIQAMKRGIMEVVDLVVVNKADGHLLHAAKEAQYHYQHALRLRQTDSATPQVVLASGVTGQGVDEIFAAIESFKEGSLKTNRLQVKRTRQNEFWMWQTFKSILLEETLADPRLQAAAKKSSELIDNHEISVRSGAMRLVEELKR